MSEPFSEEEVADRRREVEALAQQGGGAWNNYQMRRALDTIDALRAQLHGQVGAQREPPRGEVTVAECLHKVRKVDPASGYRYQCTLCGQQQKILNGVDLDALDAQIATKGQGKP